VVSVDSVSLEPIDYSQYIFDLPAVQTHESPNDAWILEYSFVASYNTSPTPQNILELYQSFQQNTTSTKFMFYYNQTQSTLSPGSTTPQQELCVMTQLLKSPLEDCSSSRLSPINIFLIVILLMAVSAVTVAIVSLVFYNFIWRRWNGYQAVDQTNSTL